MRITPLILASALIALPATAFAQTAPAPMPSAQPDAAPSAPAEPSTSASPSAPAAAGPAVPATLADLKPAAVVNDSSGAKVGTIESVTASGAVVSTGTARAQLPVASFTKNANGLVIGATKAQLEAAVAKASGK